MADHDHDHQYQSSSDDQIKSNQIKPHAILIPYPLQGHLIPSVHLALKLASQGFTITFINTHSIHHQTTKSQPHPHASDLFADTGLDIRYRTVSDGLPVDFDRSLNHDQFMAALLHVFSAHVDEVVGEIVKSNSEQSPVSCLIADTFFVWPSKIAKKFGLLYASYWTEPALVFTLYYHLDLLRKNGHFACHELEPDTILALQANMPFYAIGPIFPSGFSKSPVATSLWSESDCTQWLNTNPHGSVLYVSFGSYAHVTKRDLLEIANGLLLSNVNFVWVLRPDIVSSDDVDPLPVGFREEVRDRSMIVPWCCQIAVLAHPAIGGFLTHCGWNSILESIWCKVPLLCFPLLTDQFTNRKLVVNDWKIGISLKKQGLVNRNEVSETINRLMCGKSGLDYRKAIQEVKTTLDNALRPNGSSEQNMDRPHIVSSDDADPLPIGFWAGVHERSMIIAWYCQTAVLAHPPTGGFLPHCGWNSILESFWCQVPLLSSLYSLINSLTGSHNP
ncbi:hypothetical protein TIFTF001_000768 [Ficus carica]|uniref:Glycosyltransferase n=1 Tax=Ficus carica TaxID=3494 RepID=A0AA88CPX4_FICCA|nr:hypothetical protein TIFTF001_000768 [Ficus carica]